MTVYSIKEGYLMRIETKLVFSNL